MLVLMTGCFLDPEALDIDTGTPHFYAHPLQLQNQPDQTHFFTEVGLEVRAHEIGEWQAGQFLHGLAVVFFQRLSDAVSYVGMLLLEERSCGLRFCLRGEVALLLILLEGELIVALGCGRAGLRGFPGDLLLVETVVGFWEVVAELRVPHSKVINANDM